MSQNNSYILQLEDSSSNRSYVIEVSEDVHDRAMNDMAFATKLLESHKSTMVQPIVQTNMVACSSQSNNDANLTPLQILEEESGQMYTLLLTPEDHERALTDSAFTQQLLQNHKETYAIAPLEAATNIVQDDDDPEEEEQHVTAQLGKGKRKSRRCTWTSEQTLLLITLYETHRKPYDDGKITSRNMFKDIVKGMAEQGLSYTVNQCTDKIESLKKKFKDVYDHNAKSGNDRRTCEHYDRLYDLFSSKPFIRPLSLAGSNMPLNMDDSDVEDSPNKSKKPKTALNEAKLKYLEDGMLDRQLRREALVEYRAKKLEALNKIIDVLQSPRKNTQNDVTSREILCRISL